MKKIILWACIISAPPCYAMTAIPQKTQTTSDWGTLSIKNSSEQTLLADVSFAHSATCVIASFFDVYVESGQVDIVQQFELEPHFKVTIPIDQGIESQVNHEWTIASLLYAHTISIRPAIQPGFYRFLGLIGCNPNKKIIKGQWSTQDLSLEIIANTKGELDFLETSQI